MFVDDEYQEESSFTPRKKSKLESLVTSRLKSLKIGKSKDPDADSVVPEGPI
jgi:hypothetical protein